MARRAMLVMVAIIAVTAPSPSVSAGSQQPTNTLLFVTSDSVRYGVSFALPLAVTNAGPPNGPSPTGQVEIWRSSDGQATFGRVGVVTLRAAGPDSSNAEFEETDLLAPGVYHYHAVYTGEPVDPDPAVDNYGPSQSDVANGAAGITVRASTNTLLTAPASVEAGADATLDASVAVEPAGSLAPSGSVEFRRDGDVIGTVAVSDGRAGLVDVAPALGAHTYTARFVPSDRLLLGSTSDAASTQVATATTTTTIATTLTTTTTSPAPTTNTTLATGITTTTAGPAVTSTTADVPRPGDAGGAIPAASRPSTVPTAPSTTAATSTTTTSTPPTTAPTPAGPTTTTVTSTATSTTSTAPRLAVPTPPATASPGATPSAPPASISIRGGNAPDAGEGARRSSLVASIPTWRQIDWAPAQVAAGCVLALLVILMLEIPSAIFNHTLRNNYARVVATFGGAAEQLHRVDMAMMQLPNLVLLAGFAAISALASATLDARLHVDATSLVLVVAMFVSFSVITAINEVLRIPYLRRRTGQIGHLRLFPLGFVIGTVLVSMSRLADVHPGYVFGITSTLLFATPIEEADEARSNTVTGATLLGVALLAWIGWQPISGSATDPGAGVALVFVDAVLSTLWLSALQVLLFQFSGLAGMKGASIRRCNRGAWLAIYGAAAFMLVKMVLSPRAWRWGALTSAGFVATMIGFAAFTTAAVAFRVWARRPPPSVARSGRSVTT